jgi:hypothetical protein
MATLSEIILSRKISTKSVSRHFAGWKEREFVLDRINRLLIIQSLDKPQTTIISLVSPEVTLGTHYYSKDQYYWLWLRYFDKEEKSTKEVIMKFEFYERMEMWEKVTDTNSIEFYCELSIFSLFFKGTEWNYSNVPFVPERK